MKLWLKDLPGYLHCSTFRIDCYSLGNPYPSNVSVFSVKKMAEKFWATGFI